ncbi:transcription regulator [Calothrix sp. PCC 7716]|nr:transcription regulator [Calothrix sp. PCC 7716]
MTPTSNQKTYTDLLIQYQPKPITTFDEYNKALAIVERMMSGELTEAENTLFELLVLLIETYEQEHYPMGTPTPAATLESLMHEFDVAPISLVEILGSLDIVNEVVNGQRGVSQSQAELLAKYFNALSPGLSMTAIDFR